jgi:hypothetical protein
MKRLTLISLAVTVLVACAATPQAAAAEKASPPPVVTKLRTIDSCPTASVMAFSAAPAHALDTLSFPTLKPDRFPLEKLGPVLVLPFLMAGLVGVRTTSADKDSPFVGQSVRAQYNALVSSFNYFMMNGVLSTTVATQPVCATATVTSKVKTTNATVLKESGVAVALGASDNFWTLTGANLAAGFFRRYLLLDTAGVASVLGSSDAATKAACTWGALPADGTSIVGILTIQNVTNPFIPGTTLLGAAGVTATYIDGIDDSVFLHAQVTP